MTFLITNINYLNILNYILYSFYWLCLFLTEVVPITQMPVDPGVRLSAEMVIFLSTLFLLKYFLKLDKLFSCILSCIRHSFNVFFFYT